MSYTENLADFGARERRMLVELLQAWDTQGLPQSFADDNVRPAMNSNSGNVFLVNDDYQTAMMNGDKLELFVSTPYHGHEGFISDLLDEYSPDDLNGEDERFLREMAEAEGVDLPDAWQESDEDEEEDTDTEDGQTLDHRG